MRLFRILQLALLGGACVTSVGMRAQEPTPAAPPSAAPPSAAPSNPAPPNLDGHTLFAEKGCAHCHGPEGIGTGDGPSLRGLAKRMPPNAMRRQIVEGGKSMPAFGDVLTPEETDALLTWLRTLKTAPKPHLKHTNS